MPGQITSTASEGATINGASSVRTAIGFRYRKISNVPRMSPSPENIDRRDSMLQSKYFCGLLAVFYVRCFEGSMLFPGDLAVKSNKF